MPNSWSKQGLWLVLEGERLLNSAESVWLKSSCALSLSLSLSVPSLSLLVGDGYMTKQNPTCEGKLARRLWYTVKQNSVELGRGGLRARDASEMEWVRVT